MAERAAHLVDEVFPAVPVRQWVLSLPFALRYKMAWDHKLELRLLRIFWRCIETHYQTKAQERGLACARTGAVTVIQRAGGALNLNPHFHSAVIDGVFVEEEDDSLKFCRLRAPTTEEIIVVTKDFRKRAVKLLGRDNFYFGEEEDTWNDSLADESPALATASMASIYQLTAFRPRAGVRLMRLIDPDLEEVRVVSQRKRHARIQGFDLHVGAAVPARDRQRLERMLRYLLRPPIAESRLKELPDGEILLNLKHPWRDGTTGIIFEPVEFLGKVAAIIPRPHINQIIYHGALGARYKNRRKVVGYGRLPEKPDSDAEEIGDPDNPRYIKWAELMSRTFGIDVLACEKCRGRMEVIALIDQRPLIEKILNHLGLPTEVPRAKPCRAPPGKVGLEEADQLTLDLGDLDGIDDPNAYAE